MKTFRTWNTEEQRYETNKQIMITAEGVVVAINKGELEPQFSWRTEELVNIKDVFGRNLYVNDLVTVDESLKLIIHSNDFVNPLRLYDLTNGATDPITEKTKMYHAGAARENIKVIDEYPRGKFLKNYMLEGKYCE